MILSDRDIRAQLDAGRVVIEPFDAPSAVQPSSIDVRVGHEFRVFANSRYPYIDVRQPMEGLTEMVEASEEEPFILHPGEFVLASTLEKVSLPDDLVARLEGKSSLGRLGLLIHSSLPAGEPVLFLDEHGRLAPRPIDEIVRKQLAGCVVAFDPESFEVAYEPVTGWYEGPADRIYEVALVSGRRVRVTAGHNLFALDADGAVAKVRTQELVPGTRVAVPSHVPSPPSGAAELDLVELAPEHHYGELVCDGPAVDATFDAVADQVAADLRDEGYRHVDFCRSSSRLPLQVALRHPTWRHAVGAGDRLTVRGSRRGLPVRLPVDADLAWLLGRLVVSGHRRPDHVVVRSADQAVLERAADVLDRLELPVRRSAGAVTCRSPLLSHVMVWLGVGVGGAAARVPGVAYGWPHELVEAFLEGCAAGDASDDSGQGVSWTSSAVLAGDRQLLQLRLGREADPTQRADIGRGMRHGAHGDLRWDRVVVVRDTGTSEPIYDLEVRPGGRRIENFLAGAGGVFVSNTAGFIDAGWSGHLTLELSNVANLPITIYPGMKIGQLALFQLSSPAEVPYGSDRLGSKYQGQSGPTASRYYENFRDDTD